MRRRLPNSLSLPMVDSPFSAGDPDSEGSERPLAGVDGRVPLPLVLCFPKLPKLSMLLRVPGEYLTSFLKGLRKSGADGGRPLIDFLLDSRISAELVNSDDPDG